jgi:hypothetical protein
MHRTSKQIEIELNNATNRLDELTRMRDRLNEHLKTLQDGFINGKTSLDAVQAEQGKLTTLDSSIKALEAKQSELHDAFQTASGSEARQKLLEKAKETAVEAEVFHNEYFNMRNDFHDVIRDYAEKLIDKLAAYRGKQNEFGRLADQTKLTFQELEQLGLSAESHQIAVTNYISYQPFEYGAVVALAERLLAEKINRAAQEKRTAEFDKIRAANKKKIKAQIEAESNKSESALITYSR